MSRKRHADSSYPHRGTARGDEVVGSCEAVGCGTTLRRGDAFVTLIGDRLVCRRCHERSGLELKEPRSPNLKRRYGQTSELNHNSFLDSAHDCAAAERAQQMRGHGMQSEVA